MGNIAIIGASSGIGKNLAQLLREEHNVYATYNTTPPELADGTMQKINVLDPNFEEQLQFPEVLDGLVYCPGSIQLKPFHRFNETDFLQDYQLQVLGAIKTIQKALPSLKNSSQASIVLFSTIAVQKGFGFHSLVSTHKGALEGLTRALSAEFAPKIRVNCIAPSLTETTLAKQLLSTEEKKQKLAEQNPMKKIGQPEDVAEMASFFLSKKANWITGQVFHVDGGASTI